ncbi:DNA polymerase lambda [Colletotrichum sidae]|uniref:DNA polymerase lambda n=1 Tax=Colletotrichum sidae TaxID=1347389 RepID=A0A4R8PEN5_9PEZI|nr:DNA polymerase lambda [Colletotrichum sidae]
MANNNPSSREKSRFFHQLEAIRNINDDDDVLQQREEAQRRQIKAFQAAAQPRPTPQVVAQPERETLRSAASSQQRDRSAGAMSDPVSAPLTEAKRKEAIIERTPLAELKGPGRKDRSIAALDSSFVEDTPIPDSSSRPPLQPLATMTRGVKTPNPTKRHLAARLPEYSPSVTAMKKRKRDPPLKMMPEEKQVFRGLRFFYIPNNDISPLRKMRIRRALEFGSTWTQNLEDATHVIVDNNLNWQDIQKVLSTPVGALSSIIVTEDYPLDCFYFKLKLNHKQKQYQIPGRPESPTSSVPEPPSAQPPATPIQDRPLKPRQTNPHKWDYVPPPSTPSRSQDSSQRQSHGQPPSDSSSVLKDITPAVQAVDEYAPAFTVSRALDVDPVATEEPMSTPKDELENVIAQMQQLRGLPLEHDEEEPRSPELAEEETTDGGSSEGERGKKRRAGTKIRGRKDLTWEDRFACHKGGTKGGDTENPNNRTIDVLQKMCDYYARTNDTWRPMAYRKAITQLKRQSTKITTAEEAIRLPGVGQRLADKIQEIVTTNRLQRLEHAEREPMDDVLQTFLKIYGVGSVQASQWISQGFRTLDDLKTKAKLTTNQRIGIDHYDDLNTRIPRAEVKMLGVFVKSEAAKLDPCVQLIVSGSYRRGADDSGDIDFLVTKKGTRSTSELKWFLDELVGTLEAQKFLVARLASSRDGSDGSKWHGCCVLPKIRGFNEQNYQKVWRRVDFLLVPDTEIGAALLYFTGNDIFNRSIRLLASKKGMRLNQRGLYKDVMRGPGRVKVTEGELVEGRDEKRIFEILGVQWREPHQRWC